MPVIVHNTPYDYKKATGDLPYPTGTLLQADDGNTVHVVDAFNKLRWIADPAQFESLGFKWGDIIRVPRSTMDLYVSTGEITSPGVAWTKWGTKITDADPLILKLSSSSSATTNKWVKWLIVAGIVVGGYFIYKKFKK